MEEAEEMFLTAYHEREKVLGTNDSLTINAQYSLLRVLEIRYKGKNGDIAQEHQKRVIEFLVTIYRANEKFLGKIIWWNMTFTLWIPLQWDIKRQRITTKL